MPFAFFKVWNYIPGILWLHEGLLSWGGYSLLSSKQLCLIQKKEKKTHLVLIRKMWGGLMFKELCRCLPFFPVFPFLVLGFHYDCVMLLCHDTVFCPFFRCTAWTMCVDCCLSSTLRSQISFTGSGSHSSYMLGESVAGSSCSFSFLPGKRIKY